MESNEIRVAVVVPPGLDSAPRQMLAAAESYVVDCPEMYEAAADDLKSVKAKYKAIEAQRVEIVGPLNKAVKAVNDLFRSPLDFLEKAETTLKNRLLAYDQEQERKRRAEQARLDAERRAEQERLRREAEEAARAEREARLKAEAEARAAREALAKIQDEAARKAAQEAAQAAQAKAEAEAEAAAERAAIMAEQSAMADLAPAPYVAPTGGDVKGLSTRSKYKAEVTDMGAFLQAVAARPELQNLVRADQSALNKMAGALKSALSIPGVRVYAERQLSSRS